VEDLSDLASEAKRQALDASDTCTGQLQQVVTVAVGSTNGVKVQAAIAAFRRAFPKHTIEARGVKAPSGVSDQPTGDMETRRGAVNRAEAASQLYLEEMGKLPDFSVGLEGGVGDDFEPLSDGQAELALECFAWMATRSKEARLGVARSASLHLPPEVARLVRGGMELGDADDKVFNRNGSKTQDGAVGILTKGEITRTTYYEQPLLLSLVPFINTQLYQDV